MLVTVVLIPPLMRWATRAELVDVPNERKVHATAIPRVGGIAMVLGALVPLVLWLPLDQRTIGILLASFVILAFGIWDDKKDIDFKFKFLGQFLAAIIVVFISDIKLQTLPFAGMEPLDSVITIPITIFCLLAITNAMNLVDGLDGLAGGTNLLGFGIIAIMALPIDGQSIVLISLSVIGCILGFLRFNTHPASIFMGDSGSQYLGFIIGVLVLILTQQNDVAISPAMPLLLLGLPILDTSMVMAIRIFNRRSPFSPDKNHIHHQLIGLGFSHYNSVVILYVLQAILVVSAYYLRYATDSTIVLTYLGFCVVLLTLLRVGRQEKWRRKITKLDQFRAMVLGRLKYLRSSQVELVLTKFIGFSLPVFFLLSITELSTDDIQTWVLTVVLAAMLGSLALRYQIQSPLLIWWERLIMYLMVTASIYFMHNMENISETQTLMTTAYVFVIGLGLLASVFIKKSDRFETSPLDFLVIIIALLIPNVPVLNSSEYYSGVMIGKLIVLLYAAEYYINSHHRKRVDYGLGIVFGLMFFSMRLITN